MDISGTYVKAMLRLILQAAFFDEPTAFFDKPTLL